MSKKKWIDINERKPKLYHVSTFDPAESELLLFIVEGNILVGRYAKENEGEAYFVEERSFEVITNITHWIPFSLLPPIPIHLNIRIEALYR